MRRIPVLLLALAFAWLAAYAAPAARWEERPFFARRPRQPVPPPQYYATTAEVPAGAEVRVKVVSCPKKAGLDLHDFIGGPVFARGVPKSFTDLEAGQTF